MKRLKLFFACLLMAVLSIGQVWADTYEQLTSIDNIDGSAQYVLGIDGTGFHYQGTSSWGKTDLPSAQTPIYYTLTKASDGKSFTAQATISSTTYYLQVPTSNTFSMATSAGTNTDLIIGTTQVSGTNYAVANKSTTARHLRINGTSGLRSYAGTTGTMAFFYKVVADTKTLSSLAISGDLSTKSYEEGQSLDFSGLAVEATYSDNSKQDVTSNVEWSFTPALAVGTSSYTVTATIGEISDSKEITGVTVTEHVVTPGKYDDILLANALWGTSYSGTASATSLAGSTHDISITMTKGGTTSMYVTNTGTRAYGSYTLEFTVPTGYVITNIAFAKDASKWDITGAGLNDDKDAWSGEANSVSFGFGSRTDLTTVSVTYALYVAPTVAAPTFSVDEGSYLDAQSVELECATTGAEIRYTLDNTDPDENSTLYESAIPVSATTTIKAIAILGENSSSISSATYTIITPQSVDEVWNSITSDGPEDAYVWGYVSQTNVKGYDNNFYISVNGSTEGNQLYAYRMNMNSFSVAVGDKVVLNGDLTIYGEDKEFQYTSADKCGKIISLEPKGALQSVAVSGTPTKTVYANGDAFEPAGLIVTATYANGYAADVTSEINAEDWAFDPETITASGNVDVMVTYGGKTSEIVSVPVTVAAKTLVSIALSYDAVDVYQGLELPKPTVTATYSEGDPEDVTAQAEFTGYNASTTGEQEITVTYTFGGHDETANYTVTVKPIYDVELAADVARDLIINSVGSAGSGDNEMIVRGIVSQVYSPSSGKQSYWISVDGSTNKVEAYKGLYLESAAFDNNNKLRVGDEVKVKGSVVYFNSSTPEFTEGNILQSLARTPNFAITDVAELEVGAADLAVDDLTITVEGEGAVTFASSDNTDAVTIVDGKLHAVAAGTATITANLAADGIYKAATTEFDVTVIAATTKYAISFDGNGADGGTAPVIADKAAGVSVDLPANSFTYAGHLFTGWKVFNDDTSEEIEVNAGAFEMPASTVTIQAQWAEISVWATTYTSNVTLSYTGTGEANSQVKINDEDYPAQKVGSSGNDGSVVVTVPYGTHTLHFHAVAWNGKSVTIAASGVENMSESSFTLAADPGFKSSGTYTLENDPVGQYFVMTFTAVTEETQITFSKTAGDDKRFMLYGVNQEGGVLPVLDHIAITGTMTNTTGWKTGDHIVPEGLTVTAYYTLNDAAHHDADVTDDVTWSHAALTEGQTEVTLTATYTDGVEKSASTNVTIDAVETGSPTIITNPSTQMTFTAIDKGAELPDAKTISVELKNIATATATLGGTNPEVFAISKTTGIVDGDVISVTIPSTDIDAASYSATVTIKDDATTTQKVINLYITINEPAAVETPVGTDTKWVPATTISDGMQVLITGMKSDDVYAMGGQNTNNRAAVKGSVDGEGIFTPGANTMAFTLVAQGDGTYALRTSLDQYLYASTSNKNHLRTQDEVDDNAKWTLSVTSAVAESSSNRNVMQFNTNDLIFSCYGSASQADIKLYVPYVAPTYSVNIATGIENGTVTADPTSAEAGGTITLTITPADGYELSTLSVIGDVSGDEVTVTSNQFSMPAEGVTVSATFSLIPTPTPDYTRGVTIGNYGTICLPNGGNISGAKLFDLEYYDGGASTLYLLEVEGSAMVAGKPYIFLPSVATIEVFYTDDANADAGSNNGLIGWLGNENKLIAENDGNYILYQSQYWYVNSTAYVTPNHAYIHMEDVPTEPLTPAPGAAPRRRVAMAVNGENAATGFENIESGDAPMKVMIEGTMYILRGEKVYDATGRLVK